MKEKLFASGERYEARSYELMVKLLSRIVRGLYIFKTRKGEILAASGTFYLLISFCPILLLFITLYGKIIGDVDIAYAHVIGALKNNIPHAAPWILQSVEQITRAQLSGKSRNLLNIVVLAYAGLGFSSSLSFGIGHLSGRKQKGGMIFEDAKAILGGVFLAIFITLLLVVHTNPAFMTAYFAKLGIAGIMLTLTKYDVIQSTLALLFFALFYKHMTSTKVRMIDAVLGSISFVILFLLGKSFYWVYLHYVREDLIKNFGNFYTLVVVFIWVYYLICSFYFAASVAYAPASLRDDKDVDLNIEQRKPPLELLKNLFIFRKK